MVGDEREFLRVEVMGESLEDCRRQAIELGERFFGGQVQARLEDARVGDKVETGEGEVSIVHFDCDFVVARRS